MCMKSDRQREESTFPEHEVREGDLITISPWQWHQFRADAGDILGFLCLVNHDRDIPVYPTEEELLALKRDPEIEKFLKK